MEQFNNQGVAVFKLTSSLKRTLELFFVLRLLLLLYRSPRLRSPPPPSFSSSLSSPPVLFPLMSFFWQGCHMSGNGQGEEKLYKVKEKSGKVGIVKKSRGKNEKNKNGWLISLKTGGNIRGRHFDLNNIFPQWRRTVCWKRISLNERVERTAVSWGQKPLLDLKLCTDLRSGKFDFSGKSQRILKNGVCGNHVWAYNNKLSTPWLNKNIYLIRRFLLFLHSLVPQSSLLQQRLPKRPKWSLRRYYNI